MSIIAILMVMSGGVFGSNQLPTKKILCPDRPGCICSLQATEQVVKHHAKADKKEICPDRPGGICNK